MSSSLNNQINARIDEIQAQIGECYSEISDKEGTLPETQNLANLSTAIRSIPTGSPDAVLIPGGATITPPTGVGEGPFTIEFIDDNDEENESNVPVAAAREISYNGASQGVEVNTVQSGMDWLSSIVLCGGVPYGKELTESWASLRARIQAGNFKGIRIGDYKTITLDGGEIVVMEVSGIDQYYRCGDIEIGHHIDFISRDCLAGIKVFNETDNNNGTEAEPNPWRASKLFQTLNDGTSGVYASLPADLKPYIIEKRALLESRYSAAGALESSSGWAWNNMGNLWVPTEPEVFGNTFWSDCDCGCGWIGGGGCNLQYPIFSGGAKHIIKGAGNGGARCNWWEANATRQTSTHACMVYGTGDANLARAAGNWIHAPLCFRIG